MKTRTIYKFLIAAGFMLLSVVVLMIGFLGTTTILVDQDENKAENIELEITEESPIVKESQSSDVIVDQPLVVLINDTQVKLNSDPVVDCENFTFARGWSTSHRGVDWAMPNGCVIGSFTAGEVVIADWCDELGYCVVVRDTDLGLEFVYAHGNGELKVKAGDRVQVGDKLMASGCTGRCYGPQLHVSVARENVRKCYECRLEIQINSSGIVE